ncbi:MAG: hypothetical protein OHK0056_25850 [Bacteriovoracaceae bacterium]
MKEIKKDEDLKIDFQKIIIEKLIATLDQDELYYTDSNSISRIIHEEIHSGKMPHGDFELVKDLSPQDIHVLISYKSGCC